jgi:predicted amino acid-binding ACT domain protein
VQCEDKIGVVAAIGQLLFGYGVNILQSDQVIHHIDAEKSFSMCFVVIA